MFDSLLFVIVPVFVLAFFGRSSRPAVPAVSAAVLPFPSVSLRSVCWRSVPLRHPSAPVRFRGRSRSGFRWLRSFVLSVPVPLAPAPLRYAASARSAVRCVVPVVGSVGSGSAVSLSAPLPGALSVAAARSLARSLGLSVSARGRLPASVLARLGSLGYWVR